MTNNEPPEDSFQSLSLPQVINTSSTDFVSDFYEPLLSRAVEYKRGVGYFTTQWLQSAARGVTELAANGGTAKWITSPIMDEDDWEAIQHGDEARRDEALKQALAETISQLQFELEYGTRNAVAWLIADEILDLQFAVPTGNLTGDFHDKFGVFYDAYGNRVAFHGSQNDSQKALENYEAYTISCDWINDREAEGVQMHEDRFNTIWSGHDENLEVYTIPDGVKNDIAELRDTDYRPYDIDDSEDQKITLRDYQQDAVDAWFENDRRGVFEMATGTGKTYTALGALRQALEHQSDPTLVVVAVPVTHLAEQWADSLRDFGFSDVNMIFGSVNNNWKSDLSTIVTDLSIGVDDLSIVLTTHVTFSSEYFREQVQGADCHRILIGDEMHRLGSESRREGLLSAYSDRIGLSATPERYYDEEGSEFLLQYFDGVVYEYSLGDAIPEFLTPYTYHPIVVEMTQEELDEYRQLSRKLAKVAGRDAENSEEVFERIAMKRAQLVKTSENKYAALSRVLRRIGDPDHLLVYTNPKQISHVQELLNERGIIQHKFTYQEDDEERQRLLKDFDNGEYDALVAMRCLDEGVDVPSTRQAIFMSNSGNPMQFIQRRGRVLRKYPGKESATLYDFIVVPAKDPPSDVAKADRGILLKELRRFEEFAANAKNEHHARNKIEELRMNYGITKEDLEPDN